MRRVVAATLLTGLLAIPLTLALGVGEDDPVTWPARMPARQTAAPAQRSTAPAAQAATPVGAARPVATAQPARSSPAEPAPVRRGSEGLIAPESAAELPRGAAGRAPRSSAPVGQVIRAPEAELAQAGDAGVRYRSLTPEEIDLRVEELSAELGIDRGSAEEFELRQELAETQWVYAEGESE